MPVGQPVAFYMHCIPSESTHNTLSFSAMQLSMDAIGIVVHHFVSSECESECESADDTDA